MNLEDDFDEICWTSLNWVESIFGEQDEGVVVEGVISSKEIRFPHTAYHPVDQNRIEIRVPHVDEPWQLYRHLTHEYVHALRPNGLPGGQATILEEGLAEHSSIYFMKANFTVAGADGKIDQSYWENSVPGPYNDAYKLVEMLIAAEGLEEMREGIRALRHDTGLPFGRITAAHLEIVFSATPKELLDALSQRFHANPEVLPSVIQ